MSDLFVSIGDSFFDTGNLQTLSQVFFPESPAPFSSFPYNDGRPSNGIGLAEAIAKDLGVEVKGTSLNRDSFFARLEVRNPFLIDDLQAVTYGTAGATSGKFGSSGGTADLSTVPIGFQSQIELYLRDLKFAQFPQGDDFEGDDDDFEGDDDDFEGDDFEVDEVTYLLDGGNNDILDLLQDQNFLYLVTPEQQGNLEVFIDNKVDEIVDNLMDGIKLLDSEDHLISNIAFLGVFPVGESPLVQKNAPAFSDLLTGIAAQVNIELAQEMANLDSESEGEFLMIDSFGIFDHLKNSFRETEQSYIDHLLSGGTDPVRNFLFLDDVHPTARFNKLASDLVAAQLPESFDIS
jgi:hypothetical protein